MEKMSEKAITRRQFIKLSAGAAGMALLSSKLSPFKKTNPHKAEAQGSGTVVKHGWCHSCHFGKCNILYKVKDGVLVGVEGDPDGPWNRGLICVRGAAAPMHLYNPYRIKSPLKRTNPEKGLDVDPGWVEITWDEAINTLAEKLVAIRKDDPRKLAWLVGFPGLPTTVGGRGSPFAGVFGSPNVLGVTGSLCSVHLSNAFMHGGFVHWPDTDYAKYLLAVGGTFGPNHAASDGGSDIVVDAIQRGLKVVVVDPRASAESRLGEWVPIRPGTEFPYLLAITHVILHEIGKIDEWFVKNRTSGPYLIGSDGDYLRDPVSSKPLIWDSVDNLAKTFDDESIKDYALEGEFEVNGQKVHPVFDLLKAGMTEYTPEWAAELTTIPAEDIRRHATELVEHAQIGSTIDINGFTFPHRPSSVYIGRGLTSHRDGHLAFWLAMVINELIGALAVPGSNVVLANPRALTPDEDGVITPEGRHSARHAWVFPPTTSDALEFLPYAFSGSRRFIDALLEPEKYHVPYKTEMFVNYAGNFFTKGSNDPDRISEALRKIPFIASVSYHSDEITMFSDLVIPDTTYIEQPLAYNFEMHRPGSATKTLAHLTHNPIVEPPYEVRVPDDVWIDVAERVGMLYGPGQLNFMLNKRLMLKPEFELALDKKYTIKEIYDHMLRSTYGPEATFDAVAEKGWILREVPPEQAYNYFYFPGNKTRHPMYNIHVKRAGDELLAGLKEAGIRHPGEIEEDVAFYYKGIPAWKPTPIQNPPEGFDFYGVVWKVPAILFDIAAVSSNPYLHEELMENPYYGKVLINKATALQKGFKDGDKVFMESQYGGKIGPYPVLTTELVHPEVAGVVSGMGRTVAGINPNTKEGIPYNQLLSSDWKTVDIITGSIEISPRLKLTKA